MNFRCLTLGLAWAGCIGAASAQPQKMPVPVEDDTNAPAALRGSKAAETAAPPETAAISSAYSQAMALYKTGDYEKAFAALKGIDPAGQDDNFIILDSRILTELKRYDEGEKLLRSRIAKITPAQGPGLIVVLGDLLLHKRSYDHAAKYYAEALKATPNDPDLTLKLIYARIGANDLPGARQLASTLVPFDPKNPYDDHAAYDFAHAALARAQDHAGEADEHIQNARTNYGITVTNRYLNTYLQFFSALDRNAPTPAPAPKKQ